MDGPAFLGLGGGLVVHGLAQQVEHASKAAVAYGHGDRPAGVHGLDTAAKAVGTGHGDAAHHVVADVLGNLGGHLAVPVLNFNGREQVGQLAIREADIQHRADDLHDGSDIMLIHWLFSLFNSAF